MTHKGLLILAVICTLSRCVMAITDIHHARHKGLDEFDPSLIGNRGNFLQSNTMEPEDDNDQETNKTEEADTMDTDDAQHTRETENSEYAPMELDGNGHNMQSIHQGTDDDTNSEEMDLDANHDQHANDAHINGESVIDALARHQAINDMHRKADEMKMAAKDMNEKEKEQIDDATTPSDVTTSSTAMPRDSVGNIIITNKTHVPHQNQEEPVDHMKALRIATESLYQRARHKNLPVGQHGKLDTPEDIYKALNDLEYVIDGYRHMQLESPNPDLNITEDTNTPATGTDTDVDTDADISTFGDDGRFMQTTIRAKQKMTDDEDDHEHDEDDDDSNIEAMEDYDEHDNNDDDVMTDHSATHGKKENYGKNGNSAPPNNAKQMSPEEAMRMLDKTITDLVGILDQVVTANTGVKNVLVQSKTDPVQIT